VQCVYDVVTMLVFFLTGHVHCAFCNVRYNVGCSKRLGMFKPNSNQSTEGQAKKGTLSDLKEQQWQKPVASKNQDWVSWLLQHFADYKVTRPHSI